MEDTILHGGEKELLALKAELQEKKRYSALLGSMDAAVEEQKQKIEKQQKKKKRLRNTCTYLNDYRNQMIGRKTHHSHTHADGI